MAPSQNGANAPKYWYTVTLENGVKPKYFLRLLKYCYTATLEMASIRNWREVVVLGEFPPLSEPMRKFSLPETLNSGDGRNWMTESSLEFKIGGLNLL